jgi:hypothetical protein
MTLVVARNEKGRIAIAADTLITEHGSPLPFQNGTIKSCMLPGDICVSFCNSPVTAEVEFRTFCEKYPDGTRFSDVLSFFEGSSARTGNDYIIAFDSNPKLVKIVDGKRVHSIANTLWIGDRAAYERFREYESKARNNIESGRAMNAVLFADELPHSPASDLHSSLRNIIADREISSVGGFFSVISNRANGFRFSVYSDMLFDWPKEKNDEYRLNINEPIDFEASQENEGYSIAQISPGYMGVNLVDFYFVKGKKVFLFHGENQYGLACKCHVINNIEAGKLAESLKQVIDAKWLLIVTSGVADAREYTRTEGQGIKLSVSVDANTFPKPPT